jgi:hypothetical protein
MAYPTGSGSEILYRGTIDGLSSTTTSFRWDNGSIGTAGTSSYVVPALHIITLLTVTFCETLGNDEILTMQLYNGSTSVNILREQALSSKATFVFNDRIVIVGGDQINCETASAANIDVVFTFIDQDWTTP